MPKTVSTPALEQPAISASPTRASCAPLDDRRERPAAARFHATDVGGLAGIARGLALVAPERGVRRQHHPRVPADRRIERAAARRATTSSAAPPSRPSSSASSSAAVSTSAPRETFTRNAPCRIRASVVSVDQRRRSAAAAGRCSETTSDSARTPCRSSRSTRRSATARRAQDRGRTPDRRSASRAPPGACRSARDRRFRASGCDGRRRRPVANASQPPARTSRSRNGTWRTSESAIERAVTATSSVVASGTFATQMPARAGRLEVDVVDADRDRRDDPQPLGEALDHVGRDGAVADEQRVGAGRPRRARRPASRRRRSAPSNPSARSRSGPSPHAVVHRVDIHSRCRISNHWCILGSAQARRQAVLRPAGEHGTNRPGFVEHATTRRAPQAIGVSSRGRSSRSRASHGRASSSLAPLSCCSSTRSARSTSSRSRSTGAGRSTTTAVSTTGCTSTRSPGASFSASARPCSAC